MLFSSCEQNQNELEPQFQDSFKKISITEIDELVGLTGTGISNRSIGSSNNLMETEYGTLRLDQIIERISSSEQIKPNYSIKLIPPSDVKGTIEYLVIEYSEGEYNQYILQFEPTGNRFDIAKSLNSFTGAIRTLYLDREIRSETNYEDGIRVELKNESRRVMEFEYCDCEYQYVESEVNSNITGEPFMEVWIVCTCYESSGSGGDSSDGSSSGGSGDSSDSGDSGDSAGTNTDPDSGGGTSNDGPSDPSNPKFPVGLTAFMSEEDWEEQINDSQLQPCMETIMNDLKNLTQGVGQTVQMFAGNTPGYNWKVQDGSLSQGTGMTSTQYNNTNGTVTTTFDSQAWKNATELSWARTMLHEAMHEYFVAYYNLNRRTFLGTYQQMVQDWNTHQNWNDVHHEEFARSLVTGIADALEEYGIKNGYNHSRQFYEDMSWAGLQGTTTFQNLSPSIKQRILNPNAIELTGADLNGNSQTQKGKNAGC